MAGAGGVDQGAGAVDGGWHWCEMEWEQGRRRGGPWAFLRALHRCTQNGRQSHLPKCVSVMGVGRVCLGAQGRKRKGVKSVGPISEGCASSPSFSCPAFAMGEMENVKC